MTTTIKCALDQGRVQFTATVDNENKWTISEGVPKALVDNLIPDLKRAGSLVCVELTNMNFDTLSERYAARAIHRLKYIFSSMEVIPPEEVKPPEPKKRVRKTRTKKISEAKTKTTPKKRTRRKTTPKKVPGEVIKEVLEKAPKKIPVKEPAKEPAKAPKKQVEIPKKSLDTDKQ